MLTRGKHSSLFGSWVSYEEKRFCECGPCGLYYKPMTIVNDDSSVINKLETSLTDDARVVIYDHHVFIVQPTGQPKCDILEDKKK